MSPRLRHLTTLEHLPRETIERLLDRAEALRDACAHGTRKLDVLAGRTVLNLFFEPSTRTRTSFELAARRLGARESVSGTKAEPGPSPRETG